MKTKLFLLALGVIGMSSVRAEPVTGQVFIVTNGHQTVKLALVPVFVFEKLAVVNEAQARQKEWLREANEFITTVEGPLTNLSVDLTLRRKSASPKVREECRALSDQARRHMEYLMSSARFFEHLPAPIASTKTDADGNFTVEVKDRSLVVIGALTTRKVFDDIESYHWLIPIEGNGPAKIMLSNDNLTSAFPAESPYHWYEPAMPYPTDTSEIRKKFTELQKQLPQAENSAKPR
jgi:hypothetical protein